MGKAREKPQDRHAAWRMKGWIVFYEKRRFCKSVTKGSELQCKGLPMDMTAVSAVF